LSDEYFSSAKLANEGRKNKKILKNITKTKHNLSLPQGVNLCGFINGEFGLGEATRIMADILEAGNIPFTIVEYQVNRHFYREKKWDHKIANEFIYNTNLLCTNMDGVPYFMRNADRSVFADRYNIGYWFWEQLSIPEDRLASFGLVDEVWVSADFFIETYSQYTDKPVTTIPLAVSLEGEDHFSRKDFGIPEDAFVFLASFNTMSTSERKNPVGVIKAFTQAFPEEENIRLVIKISSPEVQLGETKILEMIEKAPNIDIIIGTFPREKMNSMINCCDVYVSLHRSEGFGLMPAEAMYLGKPAILTNWSGNTEYMTPENCCPVGYQLIELEEDLPPYRKGFLWADPDVEQAAEYMKRLFEDKEYYDKISFNAKETIRNSFSPEAISKSIKNRLIKLGLYKE